MAPTTTAEFIRERGKAKGKFTRKCNIFKELIDDEEETLPILEATYEEVRQSFASLETICDEYIAHLNEEKASGYAEAVKNACEYAEEVNKKKNEMTKLLIKKQTTHSANVSKINVKKLNAPHFTGNLREFTSFISDFNRVIVPRYGKDSYALRQCISGDAAKYIAGCENDYNKMMERLEKQYGDPRKLVDSVINELKAIKPISEGNHEEFIKMVYLVETCFFDLEKLALTDEMNCTSVVSLIEKVLPPIQKREWVLIAGVIEDKTDLFHPLLDYLVRERNALEYMVSDVRNTDRSIHTAVSTVSDSSIVSNLQANLDNTNKVLLDVCSKFDKYLNAGPNFIKPGQNIVKCFIHNTSDHSIFNCVTFKNLNARDKLEEVKWRGICFVCLKPNHVSRFCLSNIKCDIKGKDNQICQRPHHPLLHESFVVLKSANLGSCKGDKALLSVSSVKSKGSIINVLWDCGSDTSVITHKMASKLGLRGNKIKLTIVKVGNVRDSTVTKEYIVPLQDVQGKVHEINAIGMDDITDRIEEVDLSNLNKVFPDIDVNNVTRPHGGVDLLVGVDNTDLLPIVVKTNDKFQLLKNVFGYSVRGSHPLIRSNHSSANNFIGKTNHVSVNFGDKIYVSNNDLKDQLDNFFAVENSGIECANNCPKCLCRNCPKQNHSMKEERELGIIEQGLKYNLSQKLWMVSYPWLINPNRLPNNYGAAFARLKAQENQLKKLGQSHIEMYQNEVKDMQLRQASRKLTLDELNSYHGPVQYIPHHHILKPDSKSTPLRIVFDSSMKYKGYCLNDLWAKGPNVLASLLGVLLRFREEYIGIIGDISKMYNAVLLSPTDMHTHRWLWRDMDQTRAPDHYVLTCLPFGDRPSGVIATVALRKTAEMYKDRFPLVDSVINNNTYMDDLLISINTIEEAKRLIPEIENVLSHGNFFIKHWIISGGQKDDSNNAFDTINILDTDYEKVLGMRLDTRIDCFVFKVKLNFSAKIKGTRTGPDMTKHDCINKFPSILTRRIILSQVSTFYDPMGLVLPVTLRAKMLMRELIKEAEYSSKKQKIDWDGSISSGAYSIWKEFFISLYDIEILTFKRCFKPIGAKGNPILVVFSDASLNAYGAVAYGVFQLLSGAYEANLLGAKSKIAPKHQQTMPRLELCGAVLSCRLRETIVQESNWVFESIIHIVDSMIVCSQIQKDSYDFQTFVATRVSEIQSKTKGCDWYWIDGKLNPADLLTRPCKPEMLSSNSIWQKGPQFLSLTRKLWPINQEYMSELPDKLASIMICTSNKLGFNFKDFDIYRYSNYNKLLRITCRVFSVYKYKSLLGVSRSPTPQEILEAESLWIRYIQSNLTDWESRYARLGPFIKNNIIHVGARISKWLKDNYNQDSFILLPREHPFTKLYINHLHYQNHEGVETTLAKLQTKFWVPSARKLIKNIISKCVLCRKLRMKIDHQSMGQRLDKQMKPSPPFYHSAVDLYGPFTIKDTVKRRVRTKCFGVLFTCFVTRAVYLDLTEGYSTNDFLSTFRRFVCIRGYPSTIHSDNGTQLVAADKELRNVAKQLDLNKIVDFGAAKGVHWSFNKSSDAPWYNASCESLIRLVKKGLVKAIGESILTFSELQTIMFEVSNLLNSRPIGIKPGMDIEQGVYLSPNDLLLGHSNIAVPIGAYDPTENSRKRFEFIQCVVNNFWRRWMRDYFGSLLIRQKWHVKKRNLQPGDIVLIQDSNIIRGQWKLAEVVKVDEGRDGIVRDVHLRYKLLDLSKNYVGTKDKLVTKSVHRLVVILPAEER